MVAERNLMLLQDHALVDGARRGGSAAFEELFRRYGASAWGLAAAITRRADDAQKAVVAAFAAAFGGSSPSLPAGQSARPRLLAAVRHAAAEPSHAKEGEGATGALHLGFTAPSILLVRRAFAAVPERLRSVLWLLDVQGLSLDEAAEVLEVAPGAVAALADRARLGLHEQILHDGLRATSPLACRRTSELLDAYVAESLDTAKERRVRRHLDGCDGCRERLAALDDVVPALRNVVLPLPLTLLAAARDRWSGSIVRDKGPLGLALPGRDPVPVWAQRALAGAVGAVVALGITGATILSGRGGRNGADSARQATAESPLGGDGESAMGAPSLSDLLLGGSGFVPPSLDGSSAAGGAASTPVGGDLARSGGPLPYTSGGSSTGGSTAPKPGSSGPSDTTPPPTSPPTTPPPSSPPSSPPEVPAPSGQLTVGIGGVATVTVGEECTGATVAGTTLGCAPESSDDPVAIDTGATGSSSSEPLSSATTSVTTGTSSLTSGLGL